jgi:hypothetical protein
MDINAVGTVNQDEGKPVHLKDETGEPMYHIDASGNPVIDQEGNKKPLTVTVVGSFSKRYTDAEAELANTQLARMQKRGIAPPMTKAQLDAREVKLQAAAIIAWDFVSGGKPFPISETNWNALLAKQPQWKAQVQEAIHNYADFSPAQSPS